VPESPRWLLAHGRHLFDTWGAGSAVMLICGVQAERRSLEGVTRPLSLVTPGQPAAAVGRGDIEVWHFRTVFPKVHHGAMGELLPMPKVGDLFRDVRGDDRTMRVSCHDDRGVVVPRLIEALGACGGQPVEEAHQAEAG
jgi:hypothetical protein